MKKISVLVAAAVAFGLMPHALRMESVSGSLVLLASAVALAIAVSGGAFALAIAAGALAAFAGTVLGTVSAAAGGAVLVGLAFAERTTRVRGRVAKLAHLGTAIAGGAIAGTLGQTYGSASLVVHAVAMVVASVLVLLPLLVDADDPVAHALDGLAAEVGEPARATLREGAALRRSAEHVPL